MNDTFVAPILSSPLYNPVCGQFAKANCDGVRKCRDFLKNKGKTSCIVPAHGFANFCHAGGNAFIVGQSASGYQEASSCQDVSIAVDWVLKACGTSVCEGKVVPLHYSRPNLTWLLRRTSSEWKWKCPCSDSRKCSLLACPYLIATRSLLSHLCTAKAG